MKKKAFTGKIVLTFFIAILLLLTGSPEVSGQSRDQFQSQEELSVILHALVKYDYSQGVGPVEKLHAYVLTNKDDAASRADIETRLLDFIKQKPSAGGLLAACRALRLVGSNRSVPVLEELLLQPESSDAARFALEKIPDRAAERALIKASKQARGNIKLGLISSLGECGTSDAVEHLADFVSSADKKIATAAVNALGKIGEEKSFSVLSSAIQKYRGDLKNEIAYALLACAEKLQAAGKSSLAIKAADSILTGKFSPVIHQAAFKLKAGAAGNEGRGLILKTLTGKDRTLYSPAISLIPIVFPAENIKEILPLLSRLPEPERAQLVAMLSGYSKELVLETVTGEAQSSSALVRLSAIKTLEKIGDRSAVPVLLSLAAQAKGREQAEARLALYRLQGSDVDRRLVEILSQKTLEENILAEAMSAINERRIKEARPLLIDMIKNAPEPLQVKAAAALKNIAGQADLKELTEILLSLTEETTQEALGNTIAAVARMNPRTLARGNFVREFLVAAEAPEKKALLLLLLGKVGDDSTLLLLRQALSDPNELIRDAAIRGFCDWPSSTARDDVFSIARTAKSLTHNVLALRAYLRLTGLEPYRNPEAVAADLEKALHLAKRPEEKKLILGLLPQFACEKSLEIAEVMARDEALKVEAEIAVNKIRQILKK